MWANLFQKFLKKKIPEKQLISLFTTNKINKALKFKSKNGKNFNAYLKLVNDNEKNIKKIELEFSNW